MPLFLISLAERIGVPDRFRRLFANAAAVALVAIVIAALALGFRAWLRGREHDAGVVAVQLDRNDITAQAAAKVINATSEATANQMARDDAFANDQKELQHEVENGTDDHVGPGVRSVLERMRDQQSAGRRGAGAAR